MVFLWFSYSYVSSPVRVTGWTWFSISCGSLHNEDTVLVGVRFTRLQPGSLAVTAASDRVQGTQGTWVDGRSLKWP